MKLKHGAWMSAGLLAMSPLAMAHASHQSAPNPQTYPEDQYAAEARIGLAQARLIALQVFPGRIVSEGLEKEKGGSGLRYTFEIRSGKVVHEVGVNAATGNVLENAKDND